MILVAGESSHIPHDVKALSKQLINEFGNASAIVDYLMSKILSYSKLLGFTFPSGYELSSCQVNKENGETGFILTHTKYVPDKDIRFVVFSKDNLPEPGNLVWLRSCAVRISQKGKPYIKCFTWDIKEPTHEDFIQYSELLKYFLTYCRFYWLSELKVKAEMENIPKEAFIPVCRSLSTMLVSDGQYILPTPEITAISFYDKGDEGLYYEFLVKNRYYIEVSFVEDDKQILSSKTRIIDSFIKCADIVKYSTNRIIEFENGYYLKNPVRTRFMTIAQCVSISLNRVSIHVANTPEFVICCETKEEQSKLKRAMETIEKGYERVVNLIPDGYEPHIQKLTNKVLKGVGLI